MHYEGPTPPFFLVGKRGNVLVGSRNPSIFHNPLETGGDYKRTVRLFSSSIGAYGVNDEVIQLVAMGRETRIDTLLEGKVSFRKPLLVGDIRKVRDMEWDEPKVFKDIERYYYDEAPAREAVIDLYERHDVYRLSLVLSAGILGREKRKVVTRNAITAVDSTLSSYLLSSLEGETLEDYLVFTSSLWENTFYIALHPFFPGFELVESWGGRVFTDFEGKKRKGYAERTAGAYYASRLGVYEWMYRNNLKGAVTVFRVVGEGYRRPLGVWQVRENVRAAMRKEPLRFSNRKELLRYLKRKLGGLVVHSSLLKGEQRTLWGSGL